MDGVAVIDLGKRMGRLETEQVLVRKSVDGMSDQLDEAIVDMKANNKRIDDHETRLTVRETAWKEQTLPALERLRHLELKVAGSAVVGGAIVYIGKEAIELFKMAGG